MPTFSNRDLIIPDLVVPIDKGRFRDVDTDMCPHRFLAENETWIAKSAKRSVRKVAAEFLAAVLANRLSIPTPPFGRIVTEDDVWFACLFVKNAKDLSDKQSWNDAANIREFGTLLAFDWLIANYDRDNPANTLVDYDQALDAPRLWTIDHSHSGIGVVGTEYERQISESMDNFCSMDRCGRQFVACALRHWDAIDEFCNLAEAVSLESFQTCVRMTEMAVNTKWTFGSLAAVLHGRAQRMRVLMRKKFGGMS